jgi:hypothetical protein
MSCWATKQDLSASSQWASQIQSPRDKRSYSATNTYPPLQHAEVYLRLRLLPLAIVRTLLFVANIASAALLRHGAPFVTPFGDAEAARAFFGANPFAVKVSAFFFFGSPVPLAIYAATVVSRLRYLGVRAAGTNIALFGGFARRERSQSPACAGVCLRCPRCRHRSWLRAFCTSPRSCSVALVSRWRSSFSLLESPLPATLLACCRAGWSS